MQLKQTIYSNVKLVLDEFKIAVAVQIDGNIEFKLYDIVSVRPNSNGYISSSIRHSGLGKIIRIVESNEGDFFEVVMLGSCEKGLIGLDNIAKFNGF